MAAGGEGHRAAQHPGPTTAVLIAAMSLCVLLRPPRSLGSAVKTALGAYVFTDAYLNLLHMFLDQERNQAAPRRQTKARVIHTYLWVLVRTAYIHNTATAPVAVSYCTHTSLQKVL